MTNINNELMSVIIPVYKVEEKLFRRCLESVINQTYKNLEIILIDDGSPDNCGQICDEFAKNDNRIKVLHQQNGGVSLARNIGLRFSKGNYIAFADADDFLNKDMYAYLLKNIINLNSDIVQTGFCYTKGNGDIIEKREFKSAIYNSQEEMLGGFYKERNINTGPWSKLYKRQVFDNCHFIEGYNNEDYLIIIELLVSCRRYAVLPGLYYNYVMYGDSITRNNKSKINIVSCLDIPLKIFDIVSKNNEKFIKYTYRYSCESFARGYYYTICNPKITKEEKFYFRNSFKNNFNKFFKEYKKTDALKRESSFKIIKFNLSFVFPYLYSLLYFIYAISIRKPIKFLMG